MGRRLALEGNRVGATGVAALAKALLPTFHVDRSTGSKERTDSNLQVLLLGDNRMRDRGVRELAAMLAENQSLTVLGLARNTIGKPGAIALGEALARNRGLVELQLDGNPIRDGGAAAVAAGVAENREFSALRTLWATDCGLGEYGVTALGNLLEVFKDGLLHTLLLEGNPALPADADAANEAWKTLGR